MKRMKRKLTPKMKRLSDEDCEDVGSDTESCIFAMTRPGVSINDAVHHTIHLPPICVAVIDTLEFQRLRALKQCGICHLVYPSATHSRFEHCIGVCHWAQEFLIHCGAHLSNQEPRPQILPEDKKLCVLLAGLCHDLGHGPFSHLWERFLKRLDIHWRHETCSREIFRFMIENNPIVRQSFEENGLNDEHVDLICRLISGDIPEGEENVFLYEIIANDVNGVDVDKFEYIMRDAKQFGMPFHLDISRILNNIGIVTVPGKAVDGTEVRRNHIGFRDKIAESLEEVYMCRGNLHKKCYQHKTCKAVELMLVDALVAANDHFQISWEEPTVSGDGQRRVRSCKLSECHRHVRAFLNATDTIFYDLLQSTSDELTTARTLLESMLKRDLYTLVFRKQLRMDKKSDREALQSLLVDELTSHFGRITDFEFRSCFVDVTYGKDHLPSVKYFSKENPTEAFGMSSDLIKENFHELLIFWTKGKKSLTPNDLDELQRMKMTAETVYNNLRVLPRFNS